MNEADDGQTNKFQICEKMLRVRRMKSEAVLLKFWVTGPPHDVLKTVA